MNIVLYLDIEIEFWDQHINNFNSLEIYLSEPLKDLINNFFHYVFFNDIVFDRVFIALIIIVEYVDCLFVHVICFFKLFQF